MKENWSWMTWQRKPVWHPEESRGLNRKLFLKIKQREEITEFGVGNGHKRIVLKGAEIDSRGEGFLIWLRLLAASCAAEIIGPVSCVEICMDANPSHTTLRIASSHVVTQLPLNFALQFGLCSLPPRIWD